MKQKTTWIALFLLMVTALSPAALAAAETVTVISMGSGRIKNNDTSKAKEIAIKDGLLSAVSKALTDIMPTPMIVANFQTVNEALYSDTDNFVQGYKVIAETRHNKTYRVMVEATLAPAVLRETLLASGIMLDNTNKPRILFLVEETIPQEAPPLRWWEPGMSYVKTVSDTALSLRMKNKGFEIAAHRAIYQDPAAMEVEAAPTPDMETPAPAKGFTTEEALRLAAYFDADFVVTGRAGTSRLPNTMGEEKSFNGTLSVTCINTQTGETIATTQQSIVAVNPSEMEGGESAIEQAADLVAQDLSAAIASAMKEKSKKISMIEVVVEGDNFLQNYARLSRELKTIEGVSRIKPRERRIDRAVIVVNYTGTGKALAESLLAKNFTGFGLNISDVSRNHLKLAFVPQEQE